MKQISIGELYFLKGMLGIFVVLFSILALKQEWLLIITTTMPKIIVVILIILFVVLYLITNRYIFETPIEQNKAQ
ncbi:MAG: hypothetical protein KAS01_01955 [Candidatus Pacebacteria bacterium]|nr:hypothetical protein [Candidatus Paceibacterota bacterium]